MYLLSTSNYGAVLAEVSQACGPVHCFRHAERELRKDVETHLQSGALVEHEHPGWLTPQSWFLESVGAEPPFRMDAFYRKVRQQTGWMMENGKPVGGKYSYDAENRFPWKGEPAAPVAPVYETDDIDREVEALVRSHYGEHPAQLTFLLNPHQQNRLRRPCNLLWIACPTLAPMRTRCPKRAEGSSTPD